jgi:ribulose-phosphate 3-epimerase
MLIGASLLSLPLFSAHVVMDSLCHAGIDYWHIDVMDGNFVPNLAFNPMWLQSIQKEYPSIPLDVHFMTTHIALMNVSPAFFSMSPTWFSIHVESESNAEQWVQSCQKQGIKAGLAISPETPMQTIEPYLPALDFVLLMSVNPGFGGQFFLQETFKRIETLQNLRIRHHSSFFIQVDGGIQEKEAIQLKKMNVDMIVIGSYLVCHSNPTDLLLRIAESS